MPYVAFARSCSEAGSSDRATLLCVLYLIGFIDFFGNVLYVHVVFARSCSEAACSDRTTSLCAIALIRFVAFFEVCPRYTWYLYAHATRQLWPNHTSLCVSPHSYSAMQLGCSGTVPYVTPLGSSDLAGPIFCVYFLELVL